MSAPEAKPLIEMAARIIDTRRVEPEIGAIWVANEAMKELDPEKYAERWEPLLWIGCHLQMRQIARSLLRKKFEPKDGGRKDDLFPELQWRYPTARTADDDDPTYILRDLMSGEDVTYNVARLRAEADAKNKHADALEAWHRDRK
jgi:hypothetical protein